MAKLPNIYLLTTILWFGWHTAGTVNAQTIIDRSQPKSNSRSLTEYSIYTLNKSDKLNLSAQKPTQTSPANNSDDEMLDALQQRQEKIEQNLNKLKQLTGQESKSSTVEQQDLTEEEMIDAINSRQNKIKELKKLKQLEDNIKYV